MISPPERRQEFVSPLIQGRLLKRFAWYWLVYHGLLWHGLFLLHVREHHQSREQRRAENPDVAAIPVAPLTKLYGEFCERNLSLAVCVLALLPLMSWELVRLTHRLAGPLVRFQNTLARLQRAEPVEPITLRRDDLLIEFQDAFNRYLGQLREERKGRAGLPRSARPEPAEESKDLRLITELARLQAEIHQVTGAGPKPGNGSVT